MSVHLSGPPFERSADAPSDLAGAIRSFVDSHPEGIYTEINRAGHRVFSRNSGLYHRALEILRELQQHAPDDQADIVLCFESVLDFVPAAWACIFGGYCCLPWQIQKFGSTKPAVKAKLDLIEQRLNRPVLITTSSLKARIFKTPSVNFESIICLEQEHSMPAYDSQHLKFDNRTEFFNTGKGAFLIPTSGTTSGSKIAVITNQTLRDRYTSQMSRSGNRSVIFSLPFDSISSLGIVLPSHPDSYYLQTDRFAAHPLEFLAAIEEFRIGSFGLSPSLAARLLEAAENCPRKFDLSSLDLIGFGAEMIVPEIVRKLGTQIQQMGAKDLLVTFNYGMTETGPICWTEELSLEKAVARLGHGHTPVSVGGCTPGWSLRIVNDENKPLPLGVDGNIQVWSGNKLFSGYRNDAALTEASFTRDGWFKTGDRGRVEDAALKITGRQKAMIIVNGRNIPLEEIEAPLRQMAGIRHALIAAVPVRQGNSTTDELALFFVPQTGDADRLDDLCSKLLRETMRNSGIGVKHLVPLKAADFPLTPTSKIRRDELAASYQRGDRSSHVLRPACRPQSNGGLTEPEQWLEELWKKTLKLDFYPSREDNFFDLGGDSLASAELFFAVEEKFACEIPIETFFQSPTIASLVALIGEKNSKMPPKSHAPAASGFGLIHKLQGYTGSWRGERLFPGSLVVGLNTAGHRPPIFWVFQEHNEFAQLGRHLGPEQPLYGMRSCVGIVEVKNYSTEVLETVCNRYLWEILALPLPVSSPIIVGGNCQGGIFALALARRLRQIGRTPYPLVLMEWSYSYGRYDAPVLLLYGSESQTANIYSQPQKFGPDWQADFPDNAVLPVPGEHGLFFQDENIAGLVEVLTRSETRKRLVLSSSTTG